MSGISLATRLPWPLLAAAATLVGAGLAGLARGDELYGGSVMPRQIVWTALGAGAVVVAAILPYRRLKTWAYPLLLLISVLLVAVLFTPPRNGARSWFALGPLTFQPSEFAKLAYILALSRYLMSARHHRTLLGLAAPFALTLPLLLLILKEPDLGTACLFPPMLMAMLFAAGARLKHLALVCLLGVLASPIVWREMNAEQRSRITATFRQRDGGGPQRGDDYHLHQSKQVIALGGVWGSDLAGMAVAESRAYQLPAARTDFIYCLICERWGVWGAALTLAAYLTVIGACLNIGGRTDEPFGRLICVGVAAWFGSQMVINTSMTVGLLPITGITLPLLSYGGSSLLASCLAIGLVVNVALRPGYEVGGRPFSFAAGPR
ncbi:MAG: FtsW/RodA/SpoVE family cell cycle protein [Planctomyces sp.]|nr:FtsW/RodA/SpoVE family cell cycle protein [Planctomyces sp.]